MLATAALFYWATRRTNGDFLVFVIYSSGTTIFALAVHAMLARRGLPGAKGVAIGLGVSLAAGLFQASSLSLSLIWQFDHNGLFHLAQLVGSRDPDSELAATLAHRGSDPALAVHSMIGIVDRLSPVVGPSVNPCLERVGRHQSVADTLGEVVLGILEHHFA